MNTTAEKFGYPDAVVKELDHWVVLVRPAQPTLGSLVLVCSDPVGRFGEISEGAFVELKSAISTIERVLDAAFGYDKINYLMLMMVDPDVHFHVLPRYSENRMYCETTFADSTWPGPPDITAANPFSDAVKVRLVDDLRSRFSLEGG